MKAPQFTLPNLSALFRSFNVNDPLVGGHEKKHNDTVVGQLTTDQRQLWFFEMKLTSLIEEVQQIMRRNQREHDRFTNHTVETRANHTTAQQQLNTNLRILNTTRGHVKAFKDVLIATGLPEQYSAGDYDLIICSDGCIVAKKKESGYPPNHPFDFLQGFFSDGRGPTSPFESNLGTPSPLQGLLGSLGTLFAMGGLSSDGDEDEDRVGPCDCDDPNCPVALLFGRTRASQGRMQQPADTEETASPTAPSPAPTQPPAAPVVDSTQQGDSTANNSEGLEPSPPAEASTAEAAPVAAEAPQTEARAPEETDG